MRVGKLLCLFLRAFGIQRTKTDREHEREQACRQDRVR